MKHEITDLDNNQITRYVYDPEHQANRVVVTGISGLEKSIENAFKNAKLEIKTTPYQPSTVPQIDIREIPIQTIVKEVEFKTIEVPVIVKEIEYREIEKPIYIKEMEQVRVEVPVIIKEYQTVTIKEDKYLKVLVIVNSLVGLGLLILNVLRH